MIVKLLWVSFRLTKQFFNDLIKLVCVSSSRLEAAVLLFIRGTLSAKNYTQFSLS